MPFAVNEVFSELLHNVLKFLKYGTIFIIMGCLFMACTLAAVVTTAFFFPLLLCYRKVILPIFRKCTGRQPPPEPTVPIYGTLGKLWDAFFVPLMLFVSGAPTERSQRTHPWNNKKYPKHRADMIDPALLMTVSAIQGASSRFWLFLPMFHLPILAEFGGWKDYVVIKPVGYNQTWHIGWVTGKSVGLSRIAITGPVRMLAGNEEIHFFGLTPDGVQIPLKKIGSGQIGDAGAYRRLPLL